MTQGALRYLQCVTYWGFPSEQGRRGPWPAGARTPWGKETTSKGRQILSEKCSMGPSWLLCWRMTRGGGGGGGARQEWAWRLQGSIHSIVQSPSLSIFKTFSPPERKPCNNRKLLLNIFFFQFAFSAILYKGYRTTEYFSSLPCSSLKP